MRGAFILKAWLPSDSLQNGIVGRRAQSSCGSVLIKQRCCVDRTASASCLESDECELVDALPHMQPVQRAM